jgi:hypothetical protein
MSRWYVWRKLFTYLAPTLTLSSNRKKWYSTWPTSPKTSIGCVQNDFRAYVTSSANHAPILHRHWQYLQTERREIPHDPRHLGVTSGSSKMISKTMLCSTQIVHLSCVKISTISKRTVLSLEPRHLGVPSGVSKPVFELVVRLAQTVHLSCIDTNTVSKQKEVRFDMTHVT